MAFTICEFCGRTAALVCGGVSRPEKGVVSNWYRCDSCGRFSVRDLRVPRTHVHAPLHPNSGTFITRSRTSAKCQ
jgi:hypothetical protein